MKNMPVYIKTQQDVENLFSMVKDGRLSRDQFIEKVNSLLALQYYSVPIIEKNLKTVTTRYFSEVRIGDETCCGLKVKNVQHIEAPREEGVEDSGAGVTYEKTIVTLSAALKDDTPLLIYRPDNYLTQNRFDIEAINAILEVLK